MKILFSVKHLKDKIILGLIALTLFSCSSNQSVVQKPAKKEKEVFVLVHSAWLGGWSFDGVKKNLEERGNVVITPDLKGHGNNKANPGDVEFKDYVNDVIKALDSVDGKVILLGHSFAGNVISEVAEARPEKIKALVYMAAFLLPNGVSFMDAVSGAKGSVAVENFYLSDDGTYAMVKEDKIKEAFAHDIPQSAFDSAKPYLVPEPAKPLMHKIRTTEANWGKLPKYYIQTLEDKALPQAAQRSMYSSTDVKLVFTVRSSHTPNFSNPGTIADFLSLISRLENSNVDPATTEVMKKEIEARAELWTAAFNRGDLNTITAAYTDDAVLNATPVGSFTGRDQIKSFWDAMINKNGAKNLEYVSPKIQIIDQNTAVLSSGWKMNIGEGIITLELWEKEDGQWKYSRDSFEMTKQY